MCVDVDVDMCGSQPALSTSFQKATLWRQIA